MKANNDIKARRIELCKDVTMLRSVDISTRAELVKTYKLGMRELYKVKVSDTLKLFRDNVTKPYMGCDVSGLQGIAYIYLFLQGKYEFQLIEGRNLAVRTLFLELEQGEDGVVTKYTINPAYANLFTREALNLWFTCMQGILREVKGKKTKQPTDVLTTKALHQQITQTKEKKCEEQQVPQAIKNEEQPSIPNSLSPESITPESQEPIFDAQAWAKKLELSFLAPSYEQAPLYRTDI